METGDILLLERTPIGPEETAGELFDRLSHMGGATLGSAIDQLAAGLLAPRPQDHALATTAPMLKKEMGHIDWSLPARQLQSLIRGLDPWPSAYGVIDGKRYRFFRPETIPIHSTEPPGTIYRADAQGLLVATGEDSLLLREIHPEGKKRMEVATCLCGTAIAPPTRIS